MRCVLTERRRIGFLAAVAGGAMLAMAPGAMAQYSTDFESLSPGILTGQDGYYLPAGTNSADYSVETYPACPGACNLDLSTGPGVCDIFDFLAFQNGFVAGDPCACDIDLTTGPGICDIFDFLAFQNGFVAGETGFPVNPTGGNQYIKGVGPGSLTFARAQRDITWPTGTVTMEYDVLCGTEGSPGSNNLGSFSIQPFPGSASFIHLFEWMPASTTNWRASLIGFSSAGVQFPVPYPVPGPEWEDLELNKWYRFSITIDFPTNAIIEATIIDIDTAASTTAPVLDTFLEGGSAGGSPHPTGFRFFAGGSVPGNFVCWDNASIN